MKKLKQLLLLTVVAMAASVTGYAQENGETPLDTLTRRVVAQQQMLDVLNRIKITGYIQTQFQWADSLGQQSFNGGNFSGTDKRFQLRRGRVKIQYDAPLNDLGISPAQFVLQTDVTQNGVVIKDAYAKITDPWSGWFSLTAGMQNRPFGFEIGYSSSLRESPERGRMSQIIFPNERDLGAMVTIQGPKNGNWNWIKVEGGMFNGTGGPGAAGSSSTVVSNTSDFDKKKDFIGHLVINRSVWDEKIKIGLGASYYDGGFRIDTVNTYKMGKDSLGLPAFVIDTKKADVSKTISNRNNTKRNYIGVDAQVSVDWIIGITTVRGEYIQGDQPGTSSSSNSPAAAVTSDIYNRKFNGAYFYFLQNIMQTPFQLIFKYDWYDPNTDVEGDDIGASKDVNVKNTGVTDLKYTTMGFGLAYRFNENVRFTAYYDKVENEISKNVKGYDHDLPDNLFTLRMQVKF